MGKSYLSLPCFARPQRFGHKLKATPPPFTRNLLSPPHCHLKLQTLEWRPEEVGLAAGAENSAPNPNFGKESSATSLGAYYRPTQKLQKSVCKGTFKDFAYVALSPLEALQKKRCSAAKHRMSAWVRQWRVKGSAHSCECVCVCVCVLVRLLLGGLPVGPASQCNWKMWPGKCLPSRAWKLPPRWRRRAQRRLTWPPTGRACYWDDAHIKGHFIPSPHADKCII